MEETEQFPFGAEWWHMHVADENEHRNQPSDDVPRDFIAGVPGESFAALIATYRCVEI